MICCLRSITKRTVLLLCAAIMYPAAFCAAFAQIGLGDATARVAQVTREGQPRADLGNGMYRNPVIAGNYADTAVTRVGADYYLTNCCENPRGMLVWHSRDMVNWEPYARIPLPIAGNVWAPELDYFNGLFHLYLPMMSPGTGTVWVMTARSMKGPWNKPINLGVHGIDPGLIRTPDGHSYLYVDAGRVAPLADDGLSVTGPLQKVYSGWQFPKDWTVQCFCLEAPKLLRHGGYYYLVSAEGGTDGPSTSHMAVAARSASPIGPWENSPYNPLIHTPDRSRKWWSQGHGVILDDTSGNWWMLYHAIEHGYRSLGRQTLLLPIEWTPDGWPRLANGAVADAVLTKPAGENVGAGMPLSDNFDGPTLGMQWNYANTSASATDISVGGGALRLAAHGSNPAEGSQLLVQPVNHAYEASVAVDAAPGITAGLGLTQAEQPGITGVFLRRGEMVMLVDGHPQLRLPWPEDHAWFRLVDDRHDISMYYSKDGAKWQRLDFGIEYDGRATVRITLAAAGTGTGIFHHFRYRGFDFGEPGSR